MLKLARWFSDLGREIRAEAKRINSEYANRTSFPPARIGQDRLQACKGSSEPGQTQPASCTRCGGKQLERTNTHVFCCCGHWERLSPPDADLRPRRQHDFGVTYAGFVNGGPGIIERNWQGNEISSRPAVKPRDWPRPTPLGGKVPSA